MNIGLLLVKQVMITKVITANPSMNTKETIETLYEKHIGCVVSIDNDKKCIGIFTERDAIRLVAKNVQLNQPLEKVMTKNVVTIQENCSLNEAMRMLHEQRIRHLPVVNQKGKLVGLLSVRGLRDQFCKF